MGQRVGERESTLPSITSQQSFLDLCWATCERVKTRWSAMFISLDSEEKYACYDQASKFILMGQNG